MDSRGTKHTTMSDKIRIALCQHKEKNPKLTHKEIIKWLQENYKITVSGGTISNTLKRSVELLGKSEDANLNTKRQRTVRYPYMESALFEWYSANQTRINKSGDLLKEAASKLLDFLYPGHEPFQFSNGWLEAFKKRHGIRSFRRFAEKKSVDVAVIKDVLPAITDTIDKYAPCDVYNMGETGLFYRMQADNSLATKQLEGHKQIKEHITLAICCNVDGSDKLPLWIIGKFRNPRCLKNINPANMGCTYRSNCKAWMTHAIFAEWLKAFDARVANRKVLLLLDNCNAHIPLADISNHVQLQNTTVFYLPPNKSKIHPFEAGIIRNFKAYYRRHFNHLLLQRIKDHVEVPEKIDMLQAIRMAVTAWTSDVKPETIRNCFRYCKIRTEDAAAQDVTDEELIDNEVRQDLQFQIQKLGYQNPMAITLLLNYPKENIVPSDDEFVEDHQHGDESAEVDDDSIEPTKVTPSEALKMLKSLETFWLQQDEQSLDYITVLRNMMVKIDLIQGRQLDSKVNH